MFKTSFISELLVILLSLQRQNKQNWGRDSISKTLLNDSWYQERYMILLKLIKPLYKDNLKISFFLFM